VAEITRDYVVDSVLLSSSSADIKIPFNPDMYESAELVTDTYCVPNFADDDRKLLYAFTGINIAYQYKDADSHKDDLVIYQIDIEYFIVFKVLDAKNIEDDDASLIDLAYTYIWPFFTRDFYDYTSKSGFPQIQLVRGEIDSSTGATTS